MALSASDLPAMYSLLANSMSGDENVRKPAESALSQSESRPGFCSCLMVLASQSSISRVLTRFFVLFCSRRNLAQCMSIWICENLFWNAFAIVIETVTFMDNAGSDYCEGFSFSGWYSFAGFGLLQEQYQSVLEESAWFFVRLLNFIFHSWKVFTLLWELVLKNSCMLVVVETWNLSYK